MEGESLTRSGRLKFKAQNMKNKVKDKSPNSVKSRFDARKVRKMKDDQLDIHYESQFLDDVIDAVSTGDIFLMSGTECK